MKFIFPSSFIGKKEKMRKKVFTFLVIIIAVMFLSIEVPFAGRRGMNITPYGDFCPRCGKYGTCNNPMNPGEAEKAMEDYYREKGFDIEVVKVKGRFIRANIKDKGEVVDVIIFDRHTGRIRSIY
jgi:hypothetical protein